MRKLFTIAAAILLSVATFAQAPQGFSYQAVVRDAQNAIVANQPITVSITILQGADLESATEVYSEQHSVKTNQNGLFTLVVGKGDSAGSIRTVNWSKGNCYIRTKTDYGESTSQLMSVPYALYAENVAPDNIVNVLNNSEVTNKLNFVSKADIDNFVTSADVTTTVNTALTNYATTENVNSALTKYATTESLNEYTRYEKLKEMLTEYARVSDIPEGANLSEYATIEKLNNTVAAYTPTENLAQVATTGSYTDLTNTPDIPTKVADMSDAANYLTNTSAANTYATISSLKTVATTGSYNDLTNKPTIPTVPTNVGAFTNDAGYLTADNLGDNVYSKTDIDNKINDFRQDIFDTNLPGNDNQHEYVDLGLPSGTLWATCNVGAAQPNEIGGYYVWGHTVDFETEHNFSYAITTTMSPENDAAAVSFGGNWVTPAYSEWQELIDNCYSEWTTNYNGTNTAGKIVYMAKNASDKGKSSNPVAQYSLSDLHIFFPVTGYYYNVGTNEVQMNTNGYYRVNSIVGGGKYRYQQFALITDESMAVEEIGVSSAFVIRPIWKREHNNTQIAATLADLNKIGDMPLVNVKVKITNNAGSATTPTVEFLGAAMTAGEKTFRLPAYSPVFLSVKLSNYQGNGNVKYKYEVKINNVDFDPVLGYYYLATNGLKRDNTDPTKITFVGSILPAEEIYPSYAGMNMNVAATEHSFSQTPIYKKGSGEAFNPFDSTSGQVQTDMVNQLVGPFPAANNTIEIIVLRVNQN
ncbi:MAG: hypothetical protein J6T98_05010 [Salinivirgaceae bacterium]|nr:hypothetical protein [Salinivirgaceae bacterium]